MNPRSLPIVTILYLACAIYIGQRYFSVPYSKADASALVATPLLMLVAAAMLSTARLRMPLLVTTIVFATVVPLVVIARVLYDTAADPTSHNLWPFELLLATPIGLVAALAGAAAGRLLGRLGR